MLAPLIVVSCLTAPTAPHDGHTGGGIDLMELSGKPRSYTIFPFIADRLARQRAIQSRCVMFKTRERVIDSENRIFTARYLDFCRVLSEWTLTSELDRHTSGGALG